MATLEVTTQAQLDAALKKWKPGDVVMCLGGTWDRPLVVSGSATVWASGSATVRAYDSATVWASGSATVGAYESATVEAYGSATVWASGSVTVEAHGSATVRAYGSATVRAYGSATVRASDSATVRAYDSATVRAHGSATVWASDSATVRAYGSATVRASDSATVRAYESATVEATCRVAIHKHSNGPKINGGVLIEVPDLTKLTPAEWCDYYGVEVKRNQATLYKAVDDNLTTRHAQRAGITYTVGVKISASDWDATPECGGGLHVSPRPWLARRYHEQATRYVAVKCKVSDLVVVADKCKVPTLTVLYECDEDGERLA